ncbi:MAG: hypothetical protein N2037_10900 [Acidimicrobiales bacterium]|nr:hypothetical protein [Acidimicrobiales bacterium]
MTEVPEHLLARSRARRAALGLGGDTTEGAKPTPAAAPAETGGEVASTPAATAAAKPSTATSAAPQKEPEPLPPYVEAAIRRKKIPYWAMPVVAFLPIWGVLYAQTLTKAPSKEPSQLEAGAALYSGKPACAGCHGATGGGGTGRKLAECEVVKTFPFIEQQLEFVKLGSKQGQPYGDPNREGGQRPGGYNGSLMPGFKSLTDKELLEVVRHERETIGGEKIEPKRLGPNGELLWPNGKPMLDASGKLVDGDGKPLFTPEGTLANANATEAAGGSKAQCG